ncbi:MULTISPECIES: Bax inhibitor-1/YccA family protein [unclassified Streptomyces]|uniref:Bax inhibitor-1/YccA family protein n=1 Tax=unclassified Streptomyces TaxID=2593676 RepID=UPI002E30717C|nr:MULTISPECIES: Bax inhibitor-1/YccA family protein [unclassified Streptomyces]
MKSSNPVLLSRRGFRRQEGRKTTARGPAPLIEAVVARDPIGSPRDASPAQGDESAHLLLLVADLMTMRGVLVRTALAFALTVLTAVVSWTAPPVPPTRTGWSYDLVGGAGTTAAVLTLIRCRSDRPSPGLALAHAVCEGLFLGVLSNTASTQTSPGVFVQLVLGTMAGFAGVLAAYALRWIRVGERWYGFLCAATTGLVLLMVGDVLLFPVLGAAGLGFRQVPLGVLCGVTGIGAAVPVLALHFRQVEDGLTHGALRQDSWAAAYGLTLSLTWLYVEALRPAALIPVEDD